MDAPGLSPLKLRSTSGFQSACHPPVTRDVSIVGQRLTSRLPPPASRFPLFGARVALFLPTMTYPVPCRPVSSARHRTFSLIIGFLLTGFFACAPRGAEDRSGGAKMSVTEKTAVADSLKRLVVQAYDLSKPDPVKNLMSLYPTGGRVISASGGVITTTRPQLEQRSEEHTSELQSRFDLVCRLLLEKKKKNQTTQHQLI